MIDGDPAPAVAVTLGRCDEMRAEVLLRVDPPGAVSGTLTGPQRGRDTTLPVSARLEPAAAAGLARAILTEPAYWTPDLPNLYRLRATVEPPGSTPRSVDRLVGLRRLGVRGHSLWLDGRRWVPRVVRVEGLTGIDDCKPGAIAALITEPDEAMLAHADEIGVAVLALVSEPATDPAAVADRITAWSAHPSAAIAILPATIPAATAAEIVSAARLLKDTLLLAAEVPGTAPPPAAVPPGIDALVVGLDDAASPHEAWRCGAGVPLVAWRPVEAPPEAGRAACDTLQAALAAWGSADNRNTLAWDWAGYVAGV